MLSAKYDWVRQALSMQESIQAEIPKMQNMKLKKCKRPKIKEVWDERAGNRYMKIPYA
jgi:hypothetical protein